ncbi:hypothetical protein Zmor_011847 [Zophobas morio]|uniref:UDP-glucose 4-epimerase n=1 Tax=Zophobas morio TaxID=2755281 RepID=A0AA38LZB2_9CUCU|nr:hypothetical protein Zmor_011847 [Zophobas morio]
MTLVGDGHTILVTGGAGYIGAHTVVELLGLGYAVVVVDNLVNSKKVSIKRAEEITGKKINFYEVDLCEKEALEDVFKKHQFTSCIHFAGLKSVGESVIKPLKYYYNNLTGTSVLLELLEKYACKNFVFSSSATVYGLPKSLPLKEDHSLSCVNPYGRTKLFIEEMLRDLHSSDPSWNIVILRYFNPVGAHSSGLIGEDPSDVPNNLMPFIAQTAIGRRECLNIFGGDYNTKDGTGVRDYIHVVDLALGHVCSLKKIQEKCGCVAYNLGTGRGYSVLEMVRAFEDASGKKIPYRIVERRKGDVAECYADPEKSKKELGWSASKGLQDMCKDTWNWQSQNPNGYV